MIPLTVPAIAAEEIAASERVLRSGMLVQGREVLAFEQLLAHATRRSFAVAVTNGTAALVLALRALDIAPGDEVLVPALTWPSPAHAVRLVGATPVFVDVDGDEWNAGASHFHAARSHKTKAAIVIDQFGNPARHDEIRAALADLPLIVDAACSLGSSYEGAPCGSHGVIACTSFHPRKVVTTGEGGACLTDDPEIEHKLRALRNHGQVEPGKFGYAAGNERMTELAGAIGQAQLLKLADICAARIRLLRAFREAMPELEMQLAPPKGIANAQTFGVLVGAKMAGSAARNRAIEQLLALGVQAGRLSYALHELPQFADEAQAAERAGRSLASASDITARGMAVPLYPSMTEGDHRQVLDALTRVLGRSRAER